MDSVTKDWLGRVVLILFLFMLIALYYNTMSSKPKYETLTSTTSTTLFIPPETSTTSTLITTTLYTTTTVPLASTTSVTLMQAFNFNSTVTSLSDCEKFSPETQPDCYIKFMMDERDPSICDKILDASRRSDCRLEYGINVDPAMCDSLSEEQRAICYSSAGVLLTNSRYCFKVTYPSLLKDRCVAWNAIFRSNASSCSLIGDVDLMTLCKATVSDDKNLCYAIDDRFRVNRCLECVEKLGGCDAATTFLQAKKDEDDSLRWW